MAYFIFLGNKNRWVYCFSFLPFWSTKTNLIMTRTLACVASVSVWFRSKERPVLAAREMKREPKNERGGRGRGRCPSFLPHPLPALLLVPFFAQSLTLVPRSLLLNRTDLNLPLCRKWHCFFSYFHSMYSFYPQVFYAFRTQSVPSHLRQTMYIAAVKYGGEKEWEFFWRKYKQCKNAAQREKIITALGSAKSKQLLHRYGV